MTADGPILKRWIEDTIRSYPIASRVFLSKEQDPFRNPVGHTLRCSLSVLLDQVVGEMDVGCIAPALDDIVRLRAVQDLNPSQALHFLLLLKPIMRELAADRDQLLLNDRIDQLALMAFDTYMRCREQLAEIRAKEGWYQVQACQSVD
jgi:hypothetical protein